MGTIFIQIPMKVLLRKSILNNTTFLQNRPHMYDSS